MKILLAVSGGIDSMYMLNMASELFPGATFAVAHCNFGLRGENSDADEEFVRRACEQAGYRFFSKRFDTKGFSKEKGISIEMAARELRYSWFLELCVNEGFDVTAVAHNANDNAETLLLNILRGTGGRGLRGMARQNGRILRPLLGITREEILDYMREKHLEWREDHTNAENEYKRNKIRNEVFPVFGEINPSFVRTLNEDMERFTQIDDIAEDYFLNCGLSPRATVFPVREIMALRHWKYVLWRLLSPHGMSSGNIGDLIRALESGESIAGKRFGPLVCSSDALLLDTAPVETSYKTEIVPRSEISSLVQPEGTIIMDAGKIALPLRIRHWREGDWICPLGMGGRRKKLSDIFTDMKYSLPQKESALVVEIEGSHIGALLFSRVDESLKVTDSTVEVLKITNTA